MLKGLFSVLLGVTLSALLSSCAIEEENDDKIIVPVKKEETDLSAAQKHFYDLARKCTTGDMSAAPLVVNLYRSALDARSFHPDVVFPELSSEDLSKLEKPQPFEFQSKKLNVMYEMCLQKAASEGNQNYPDYYLTSSFASAIVSRHFYAEGDTENGSYWSSRVINLLGLKDGYSVLGRIFVSDDKTFKIGTDLLKEAAKLGSDSAQHYIFDSLSSNNVFDKLSKKMAEQDPLQQDHE